MNLAANLFDAHSIVGDLGLIGVLTIIFAETGLLVGLAFPGDSLLFIAGVAASGSGAAILGGASLNPVVLFIGAPIAAIIGSQVGYWFGATYGRKLFNRPDGRFFTQSKVAATEKWLNKYGTGKALVLARFIPFVRTLINPLAGVVGIPVKKFFFWNVLGAIIWTQVAIGVGYFLGEALGDKARSYMYLIVAVIVLVTLIPVVWGLFKEWRTKHHLS
jgi:membrane-associated protein